MYGNVRQAYDSGVKATESSRALESAALYKCARLLEECRVRWNEPDVEKRLDDAIRRNLRLWSIFQAELAAPDHQMPVSLRLNLLRLSAFIDQRSLDVLEDPKPEKLQALIDIDRQIASGLATSPQDS
jgi:flagellar protein FlaF